jgi:Spy/CpxP family protein refolding chaperone
MIRKAAVFGLVVLMLVGVTYAFAKGAGPGSGQSWGRCWEGAGSGKTSLTPEQRSQLQEMRRKFHDETSQLRESIFSKRQELRSLWSDPNADPKVIINKEKEMRELRDQMQDKMVQFKLEARKVLTPEQLSEFGERGMGPGFGHGPGPGPRHGMGPGPGVGPSDRPRN